MVAVPIAIANLILRVKPNSEDRSFLIWDSSSRPEPFMMLVSAHAKLEPFHGSSQQLSKTR
ncbi:hypothetical protein HYFRA_00012685 [Hymenoscyphus fraxineus]|uniref:Uncharacterized protein n=1 Tax=Hymenoscyphus fraxineus TaxID=746836 RepID=A0A9N9L8J2_9HELO|nr:hypothetical protein HYFRA_00012685 [Hymenoscyphus fraxineus]